MSGAEESEEDNETSGSGSGDDAFYEEKVADASLGEGTRREEAGLTPEVLLNAQGFAGNVLCALRQGDRAVPYFDHKAPRLALRMVASAAAALENELRAMGPISPELRSCRLRAFGLAFQTRANKIDRMHVNAQLEKDHILMDIARRAGGVHITEVDEESPTTVAHVTGFAYLSQSEDEEPEGLSDINGEYLRDSDAPRTAPRTDGKDDNTHDFSPLRVEVNAVGTQDAKINDVDCRRYYLILQGAGGISIKAFLSRKYNEMVNSHCIWNGVRLSLLTYRIRREDDVQYLYVSKLKLENTKIKPTFLERALAVPEEDAFDARHDRDADDLV